MSSFLQHCVATKKQWFALIDFLVDYTAATTVLVITAIRLYQSY